MSHAGIIGRREVAKVEVGAGSAKVKAPAGGYFPVSDGGPRAIGARVRAVRAA